MFGAKAHTHVLAGAAVVVLGLWASSATAEEATEPPLPPLKVTLVLADSEASRPLEAQVRAYFRDAAKKHGLAVHLDLGYDSDPRRKKLLDGWRKMVREEKRRNPRIPLEFSDGERNAGFIGPLLVIGKQKILASLSDETLLRAQRMHAAQHGSRAPVADVGGGAVAVPEPPAGMGATRRAAGHPLSYPLAVVLSLLLLGVIWWTGGSRAGAAAETAGRQNRRPPEPGTPRTRRRRRRR